MTGLEKITDRILAEARAQADEIREKAEEFFYRRYQGFNTLVVRI